MKHLKLSIIIIIAVITFATSFISCDKITSNNQLDGMWQIMNVTYARNGQYDSTINAKPYKAYLAFQLKLARLYWLNLNLADNNNVLCRFTKNGSMLRLYNFYISHPDHDSLIIDSNTTIFEPIGITGNDVTFDIQQLNSEKMTLQSPFARIELRKF